MAYGSVMIAAVGMFGVFLFVTYYVQTTLHYSPIQTGVSFLPMIVMLVIAAQLGTNVLVPRLGPKVMVPIGMLLAATAMVLFTRLDVDSSYAPGLLLPLMFMGAGMGSIMPASMQTATLGVDRQYAGVAGAMVNTSQQVGGSIGTALLNTLVASCGDRVPHLPRPGDGRRGRREPHPRVRHRVLDLRRDLRGRRRAGGDRVPPPQPGPRAALGTGPRAGGGDAARSRSPSAPEPDRLEGPSAADRPVRPGRSAAEGPRRPGAAELSGPRGRVRGC